MSKLKLFLLSLSFILAAPFLSFAEDTLTITTYYPSPYGVYREMRSQRMAIGYNYIDNPDYTWEDENGDGGEIDYLADLVVEGNVGIGTTSPVAPLDIKGSVTTTNGLLKLTSQSKWTGSTNEYRTLSFSHYDGNLIGWIGYWDNNAASIGTDDIMHFYNGAANGFRFHTQSKNNSFVILNNGNVGIGTTAPSSLAKLTVQAGTTGNYTLQLNANGKTIDIGPQNASWSHLQTDTTNGFYFYRYAYFNEGYGSSSSRKLKKNIAPVNNALDKIAKLNGVYFDWIANGKHDIGMIAEDVDKVMPEVVTVAKDGTIGLTYDRLIALTIEGIKEQQKQINDLRQTVSYLEQEISKIRKQDKKEKEQSSPSL